jgi:hypothetical protein
LGAAQYGRFLPAEKDRAWRVQFDTIRALTPVAFKIEKIVTQSPQETLYTDSLRGGMLINEDYHAPWVVGFSVAIVSFDFINRTEDELPIKLVDHVHMGKIILLKAPCRWSVEDKRANIMKTRVCGTRRCNRLGGKREKIWKSLRDRGD